MEEKSLLLNCESKIESNSSEHWCCKYLNVNGNSGIAYRRRGISFDIKDKILQSRDKRIRTVSAFLDFLGSFDNSSNAEDDDLGSNDVVYMDSRKSSSKNFENEKENIENYFFVDYPQQNTVIGSKENNEIWYNTTSRVMCQFCLKNNKADIY